MITPIQYVTAPLTQRSPVRMMGNCMRMATVSQYPHKRNATSPTTSTAGKSRNNKAGAPQARCTTRRKSSRGARTP